MMDRRIIAGAGVAVMVIGMMGVVAGCGPVNRLQECDFDDHTAAVVVTAPPAPFLSGRTNAAARAPGRPPLRVDNTTPRLDLSVLMPTKRRQILARIDSASTYLDAAARIARKTRIGTAHDLGFRPVDDAETADYLLRITVRDYGFFMNRHLFTDFWVSADMRLIDQRERRPVWERKVQKIVLASEVMAGLHVTLGYRTYDQVATLAEMSLEEMTAVLDHVADFTAATLTTALLDDYYASR